MALPFLRFVRACQTTVGIDARPLSPLVACELPTFESPIGSSMQSLALPPPSSERRAAPLEAFSRTEKIIAFCRVLLALGTLAVVVVDPKQPAFLPPGGSAVPGAFLSLS